MSNAPKKNTKNIRTPQLQGSRRKGKQSQEEKWTTKSYLIWFLKIWALGCLSHFASSSFLWSFPSLVDLGCFLIVSGHKSEKPQAESCSDGTKANPNLCFVWNFYQNGSVLFTLACYQGKYWVIRWNLLQPSVKDYWTRLVVWLVKYYVDIVRKVFALVRNCTNFVLEAYWNARIIRLSAFTLKVLRKVLMRKEEKYYSVSQERRPATVNCCVILISLWFRCFTKNWRSSALSYSKNDLFVLCWRGT